MIRPPPKSTLFPSTTLFRSVGDDAGAQRAQDLRPAAAPRRGRHVHRRAAAREAAAARPRDALRRTADLPHAPHERGAEDRKSTRLNSSHANISYAVFCLKKK